MHGLQLDRCDAGLYYRYQHMAQAPVRGVPRRATQDMPVRGGGRQDALQPRCPAQQTWWLAARQPRPQPRKPLRIRNS